MTVRIETDPIGRDVIWSEVGGKAVRLPVENILIRASDGHVFTTPPGSYRWTVLERLRPHEVAMVEFWLREKAVEIAPNIFAGEPAPDG